MTYRIAEHPREVSERVGEYLKEGNLDAIVTLFHPDCKIYLPPDEPPHAGHAGVRDAFAPFLEGRPTLISQVIGEAIIGDIALLQAKWRIEDNDGNVLDEGNSTEVVKRLENGGWGYFIDCPLGLPST
ncbi:MAG: nuclear transport factor 2 family protein [Cyanobacteria bacterium P01_D01_bin.44]